MLLVGFLVVWLIYAVFIIRFVRRQLTEGLLDITDENVEMARKFDCFCRKDIPKWNRLEMYFTAVFLLPIRFIHFLVSTATCTLLTKIALIGTHHTKELSVFRRTWIKSVSQVLARSCLYSFGFYHINHVKLDIASIDPTYPRVQVLKNQGKQAPVIVSNHISWVDIFIYMTSPECPSYLAKHEVEKYPLVGPIAQALQCLFVERESKDNRGGIVTQLQERIKNFERNPVTVPQVLIFPEGTTTNGEYIISFKKGAFTNFSPIKIYGLKYNKKSYCPALDSLGMGRSLLFTLLQLYNSVTIYDLGVFYPDYLNLKKEEDWPIYAKKIKDIMVKVLEMKSSEMGFADKMGYYKTLLPKKLQ